MLDDIEVELVNDQQETPADSEVPTTETPAVEGEKQTEASEKSEEKESFTEDEPKPKEDLIEDSKLDDDLDEWAEKTGHGKPETERERKAMQLLRDNQREFTKDRQSKKGIDAVKGALKTEQDAVVIEAEEIFDPLEKRLIAMEADRQAERTSRLQSEFFTANSIGEETGTIMANIITEKVAKATTPEAKQKVIDHWAHPEQLQDLYDLAKARELNASGKEGVADEAAKKERERIAQLQKAEGPNRNAKNTVPQAQEEFLDKLWKD